MDNNSLQELGLPSTSALFARPVDITNKGIIIFTDRYGISTPYMKRYADAIAQRGFITLMPDFFHESQWRFENEAKEYENWKNNQLSLINRMKEDLSDTVTLMKEAGSEYIGVVGFGFGAELFLRILIELQDTNTSLSDDESFEFSSIVLFYPDSMDLRWGERLKAPTFFIFGERDRVFPLSQVFELSEYLEKAVVSTTFQVFKGQVHGFAHLDGMDATEISMQAANKMVDWHFQYMGDEFGGRRGRMEEDNNEMNDWLAENILRGPPTEGDWWPGGSKSRFYNVGLATWEIARERWRKERQQKPASPPPVNYYQLIEVLTSGKRTGTLPGRMKLSDLVETLHDIWEEDSDG